MDLICLRKKLVDLENGKRSVECLITVFNGSQKKMEMFKELHFINGRIFQIKEIIKECDKE